SGLRRHGRRFFQGKREAECGAAGGHALGPRLSAVQTNDRAANRKAKADAAAAAFDRAAMELREHALDIAVRQTAAVILDGHDDLVAAALCAKPHDGAPRR